MGRDHSDWQVGWPPVTEQIVSLHREHEPYASTSPVIILWTPSRTPQGWGSVSTGIK